MQPENNHLQLSKLRPGSRGKIVAVRATGPLLQRLLAMGFTRGSEIELVKRAPLQDPIQFKLRGSNVTLRSAEAETVFVTGFAV